MTRTWLRELDKVSKRDPVAAARITRTGFSGRCSESANPATCKAEHDIPRLRTVLHHG
jgi:hypothetical protein